MDIKQDKNKLLKDTNSKEDEYCFEVSIDGVKCYSNGFKTIEAQIREPIVLNNNNNAYCYQPRTYDTCNIEAKVR